MQIEINNDMIETIINRQIKEYIEQWFNSESNKYYIRDKVNEYVKEIVSCKIDSIGVDFNKAIRSIETKDLVERVTSRISSDIANAFVDKFSDY